ncbi:MAG: hypothetical protein WCR36_05670, partial [Bacteroidaceae bacterium]
LVSDNTAAIDALGNALTALTNRVSTLEVAVAQNVTDIAANKALIEAQMLALETYKGIVNARLDGIDGRLVGLDGDIVTINSKIDAILTRLATAETAITDITARVSATEATLNGISNADLTAMKDFLANWATTRAGISTEISDLGISLTATFRSLLNNITLAPDAWWAHELSYTGAEVTDDTAFGPAGEIVLPAIGDYNVSFASDSLFFIANPSTVDWSGLELSLKNSAGTKLTNVSFSTPESTTRILTRAASSSAPVLQTGISFDAPEVSQAWIDATRENGNYTSYVLTVTDPTDGREIYSNDGIVLYRMGINVNTTLTATAASPVAIYEAGETPTAAEKTNAMLSSINYVWKKYVTVSSTSAATGDIDGIDTVVDGNTMITLSTSDNTLANKTVSFVYHYLYMDGSRGEAPFDVTFTKLQYDATSVVLNSIIDFNKLAANQSATSTTVLADLSANIADVDAWLDDVATINVEPITTEIDVMPFKGTLNFETVAGISNTITVPAAIDFPYVSVADAFSTFTAGYDATVLLSEGRYGTALTFKDVLGNVINVVKVYVDIAGPSSDLFTNAVSKVTNTWNAALNVNNVWAQLSLDSQDAIYNVNSSYNGDISEVKFASTETPAGFVAFDATNGSILTIANPSSIAGHNDGLYPAQSQFSPFANFVWAVTDNFDYKVLSPVKESTPVWRSGYVNKFTYTAGGSIAISHDDIVSMDPSVASAKMYFVGNVPATRATYVSTTDMDWRIASVKFTIKDPNATAGSSNVGLAELKDINGDVQAEIVDPVSFTINAKPQGGSYAVNPSDYTLNLEMTVEDVFGFTKVTTLDFIVDNGQ